MCQSLLQLFKQTLASKLSLELPPPKFANSSDQPNIRNMATPNKTNTSRLPQGYLLMITSREL